MHSIELSPQKIAPYVIVSSAFAGYLTAFMVFHRWAGYGIGAVSIIPVIAASWYFGTWVGVFLTLVSLFINVSVLASESHSVLALFQSPSSLIGMFSLLTVSVVTGRFATLLHERRQAILKLEEYEKQREIHTKFLELLHRITARALEADSLQSTLEILTEQIAALFHADDVYFAFWDAATETPVPTLAHGSMKDIYPFMQFEPGELTPTGYAIQTEQPVFIDDLDHSPHISPRVAAVFPNRSMLCIPLIAQRHRLGAVLVGYKHLTQLKDDDIFHAEATAEQLALVLSKSQLLEDERRQVRQLTALHDVALISIAADNEDQLIEQVTDVIGKNLFPVNFGIMLLDEQTGMLRVHPSYRFYQTEDFQLQDILIGTGITGCVAQSGQAQRIGNVRGNLKYLDVDDRTISELCVPIKFKEHVLGVINAESTKRHAFTADDERLLVTVAGLLATAIEQLRKAQTERIILDQLAHDKDLIYSIAQIAAQIERSLNVDQIIQTMGHELEKIGLTCIMAAYDEKQKSFTVNYTSLAPDLLEIVENGLGYPLVKYVFPRRKLDIILKPDELVRSTVITNPEDEIAGLFLRVNKAKVPNLIKRIGITEGVEPLRLPLVFEENLLGILWIWGQGVTRSDLPILSIFAKQIGMSLDRARLFDEVQSLALTDSLTGLQNRRSLFEVGRIEFARAQRMDRPFSCMMLDIDHFKKINDNYGHQIGDQVLQEFGKRCKADVREVDLLGRYGGEEFMILLPETDLKLAFLIAERIRLDIAEHPISTESGPVSITVSIGIATKDANTTHLDALVARADQALYIAKHKGRNRVSSSN